MDPNQRPEASSSEHEEDRLAQLVAAGEPVSSHFGARLRGYFLTGLIVVGPVAITIYVVWWFIQMVDGWEFKFAQDTAKLENIILNDNGSAQTTLTYDNVSASSYRQISQDKERLVTGTQPCTFMWYLDMTKIKDIKTGKEVRRFPPAGQLGSMYGLALSPNGRLLLTGSQDETARLWNVATGEPVRRLWGHSGWVWSAAFCPNLIAGRPESPSYSEAETRIVTIPWGQSKTTLRGIVWTR